jgi:hypothetical protein
METTSFFWNARVDELIREGVGEVPEFCYFPNS